MANTYKQSTQSDMEREQRRLGIVSAQSKAYAQSRADASPGAPEIDYTTAPDRVSLYDLSKLNPPAVPGIPKSDTPVPDRISLYDLDRMNKSAGQSTSQSNTPLLDAWKAGLFRPDTDYTYALDRVPFTQANT